MKHGITINLDKPRTLRYGINALAKIEDLTNKPLVKLDLKNVGIKDLLIITYAGLCHEDSNLTIEKVGDIIDEYSSLGKIAEKVGEALTLAFGKEDKSSKGE
jgi:hypothetical protein|nr:MAG TPA: tail tube protein [Caudoviricetes sp.]